MSDPTPPTAQPHHGYKSWTSTWRDDNGRARSKRFGRVGRVAKSDAVNEWRKWLDNDYPAIKAKGAVRYSVEQLCTDWFAEMQKGYTVDGKFTATINRMKVALESFGAMYGTQEADDMTAAKVAAWLDVFLASKRKWGGKGPKTKETVNLALNYVKRMFQWGATYRHVSPTAAGGVMLVRNVRGDHQGLRQKPAIKGVSWEDVEATCKHLDATIAGMVKLEWWTGMRPGEIRGLRPCELDTSEKDVWVYRPAKHKNAWRGKERTVAIGPHGIEIIRPLLPTKTDEYVFRRPDGKQVPAWYYREALVRAAKDADVKRWTPNQLRHSAATRWRKAMGAQATQDLLGHAKLNQQQVYIDEVLERAKKLAREVG